MCTCLTQDLSVTIQVDRNDDGEEETKKGVYIVYIGQLLVDSRRNIVNKLTSRHTVLSWII